MKSVINSHTPAIFSPHFMVYLKVARLDFYRGIPHASLSIKYVAMSKDYHNCIV